MKTLKELKEDQNLKEAIRWDLTPENVFKSAVTTSPLGSSITGRSSTPRAPLAMSRLKRRRWKKEYVRLNQLVKM